MGNELTTMLKYTMTQVKHIPEPQESTYCSAEQPVYPNTRVYHIIITQVKESLDRKLLSSLRDSYLFILPP